MGMSSYVLDEQDKKFADWLSKVDQLCLDKIGAPREQLPDWCWAENFEDGLSPLEAFNEMHEAEYGETWDAVNGQFGVGA